MLMEILGMLKGGIEKIGIIFYKCIKVLKVKKIIKLLSQ